MISWGWVDGVSGRASEGTVQICDHIRVQCELKCLGIEALLALLQEGRGGRSGLCPPQVFVAPTERTLAVKK